MTIVLHKMAPNTAYSKRTSLTTSKNILREGCSGGSGSASAAWLKAKRAASTHAFCRLVRNTLPV